MATYTYKVERDDNDTFLITFPDFPEAVTWAKNMEETERRAQDAIDTAIQGRISDKEPIPEPGKATRNHGVTLSTIRAAKVAVWNIMRRKDMTKAQLARLLNWTPTQVDRLFDPRHASRFDQIEDAAEALGAVISLTVSTPGRRPKPKAAAARPRPAFKRLRTGLPARRRRPRAGH